MFEIFRGELARGWSKLIFFVHAEQLTTESASPVKTYA